MSEDTMTEDRTEEIEEQAPTIDPGDLHAALATRWPLESDKNFTARVEASKTRRDRKAEAVVQVARTVSEHDLPWPIVDSYVYGRAEGVALVVRYRAKDIDTFRLVCRAVRRAVGGLQTKSNEDGSLTATVVEGPVAWDVALTPDASPCEQVQVGTETRVTREEIEPARYREIEREEPVYEWRCPDSVLDPDLVAEAVEGDKALAKVEG